MCENGFDDEMDLDDIAFGFGFYETQAEGEKEEKQKLQYSPDEILDLGDEGDQDDENLDEDEYW